MFDRPVLIFIALVFIVAMLWWQFDQQDRCKAAGGQLVNGAFGYVCMRKGTH